MKEDDNFSLDESQFPDDTRSLRLRRMDTGAAVVIPMTRLQLVSHWHDKERRIGWHADQISLREPNNTGVFRTDIRPPRGAKGVPAVSTYPGYPCIGWGFCSDNAARRNPQRYAWNGKLLGPTVFEIAVSPMSVEEITPFSLRADAPGSAMSTPSALPADDPIVAELDSAKEAHGQAISAARQKVVHSIAELIKQVGAEGDATAIDSLIAARREFDEGDCVANPSTKLRPRLTAFYGEIDRADDTLLSAYNRAVASFERADKEQLAGFLRSEIEGGVGYEAERWVVMFSSPDPRIWNTPSRGQYRFARPLTEAPEGTRYLRMRVIPNRSTRLKKLDPVICEMTRQRLGTASAVNGIGWNGTAKEGNNGFHLGIYRLDSRIKWPTGALIGAILVFLYDPAEAMTGVFFVVTAVVSFGFGVAFPLSVTTRLNDQYMQRARICLEEGDFEGAFEDASEVLRSSDRYPEAADIVNEVREQRWSNQFGSSAGHNPAQYRYAVH